jgi:23S rRNA (adenine2030-N6)-methyltransferase
MFSYRHAFHAGNHADVLKHLALVAVLKHLLHKDTALSVVDTHAGAGLYRLDGDYAATSGEADSGIAALVAAVQEDQAKGRPTPELVLTYLDLLASFNARDELRVYPGSPALILSQLRYAARDRLRLFEMHPTDAQALAGNLAQLPNANLTSVTRQDGFEGLKALLPPPSRRGLVLMDPSYEMKSDYRQVAESIQDALRRFPTGSYLIWYPVIPRPEAHGLPKRLRTLAQQASKPWLQAVLRIGQAPSPEPTGMAPDGSLRAGPPRRGMSASGLFVINPPHTLREELNNALPYLAQRMGRGRGQGFTLEAGG